MKEQRTPVKLKAKQLSKLPKKEQPDYNYLLQVFRHNTGVRVPALIKIKLSDINLEACQHAVGNFTISLVTKKPLPH